MASIYDGLPTAELPPCAAPGGPAPTPAASAPWTRRRAAAAAVSGLAATAAVVVMVVAAASPSDSLVTVAMVPTTAAGTAAIAADTSGTTAGVGHHRRQQQFTIPEILSLGFADQQGGGYCDGRGGLHSWQHDGRDPTCRAFCSQCSAAQVVAAMEAAPDDRDVQFHGVIALDMLTIDGETAEIAAAGGTERAVAAIGRFPDDDSVPRIGCRMLGKMVDDGEALACPTACQTQWAVEQPWLAEYCEFPPPSPSACTQVGGVTLGAGDTLLMPPPGETMADNQQCMWTVACPDGAAPEVTFSAFNIENNWDFLYIDSTGDDSADMQLTGDSIPDVITGSASSNEVYIMYESDGSVNRAGFTAMVACAAVAPPPPAAPPPPDPCQGGMALSPGDTFSSPNYPSNYPRNLNCQWTMDCPSGGTPTVTFSAFNLENNWDFLQFDLTGNGAVDASLTGSSTPDPVTGSAGTPALAVFASDGSINRPGFEATFTCS
jgi:hypothetical protein